VAESKDRDFEAEDANDNDDLFGDDARQGDGDVETWESAPEESDNEDDGVDFAESSTLNPSICPTSAHPQPRIGHTMRAFDELDLLNAMAMRVSAAANSGRAAATFPSVEYMRK
jgi:hypothetical protein